MSSLSQPISALVCTRNRGNSVIRVMAAILANTHPYFELIVIDQSTNEETADAVVPFLADTRLRYIRSDMIGISRARNLGIAQARGEVVAITDDDCMVSADWLEKVAHIFAEHPNVAVAFYNVVAASHDSNLGFIPAYVRTGSRLLSTLREKCKARGIGAGMAIRAAAVKELGGFDEHLTACEEGDLAVRALLRGCQVYETDTVAVLHEGVRTYVEGRSLSRRNWLGIGAAYAKPLKCGRWDFLPVFLYEFFVLAVWPPVFDLLRLRRPQGMTRVAAFLKGLWHGVQTPIDPMTLLFCPAPFIQKFETCTSPEHQKTPSR